MKIADYVFVTAMAIELTVKESKNVNTYYNFLIIEKLTFLAEIIAKIFFFMDLIFSYTV